MSRFSIRSFQVFR
uniref:Uncharacterized protein n=1 Tax=Rhizophora mucronata TaxID=61149 RepID=A0A2P2PQB2_RHIMU